MGKEGLPAFCRHTNTEVFGFFGEYRFLSNFHPATVEYAGFSFSTVEGAYQAAKSADPQDWGRFAAMGPREAKTEGRRLHLRSDWATAKIALMANFLGQKFAREEMAQLLLATDSRNLVEGNNWGDIFWGVDVRRGGSNVLGHLLMGLRASLGGRGAPAPSRPGDQIHLF